MVHLFKKGMNEKKKWRLIAISFFITFLAHLIRLNGWRSFTV